MTLLEEVDLIALGLEFWDPSVDVDVRNCVVASINDARMHAMVYHPRNTPSAFI